MAGIGLILTSPFLVADLRASGALVPLLPDYRGQQLEINALYPHRRHLSCKVRAFIEMRVDQFAATALASARQRLGLHAGQNRSTAAGPINHP
jgi:DNA-binding transcriptional LysR family regulator